MKEEYKLNEIYNKDSLEFFKRKSRLWVWYKL